MKIRILFAGSLLPLALLAQIPEPLIPAGVGVNIHFVKGHERELDLIAAAGFKFVRMDFTWASIERQRGEYDWSGYDELTANLEKRGLRALYILDYSNPVYEKEVTSKNPISGEQHKTTASPQHPESVASFAKWAGAAAKRYSGRKVIWEIWNEPNIHFWQPKPDVEQYITLARATARAVREADPNATIVGPATSGFPWEFLEAFLKSGALEYLDAVSVHPYRDYKKPPESAGADYARLRELIERHARSTRMSKIPILSGEWGYASHTKGVALETQAAFAARQQLCNLLHGVTLSVWYDWKNDGNDPGEREHNFGTVWPDLKPKPAYVAMQTLTRELAGCRIASRYDAGSTNDFVLLLTNSDGETKLAAWTLAEAHEVTLAASPGGDRSVSVVTGQNERAQLKLKAGRLTVELTAAPKYIEIGNATLLNGAAR